MARLSDRPVFDGTKHEFNSASDRGKKFRVVRDFDMHMLPIGSIVYGTGRRRNVERLVDAQPGYKQLFATTLEAALSANVRSTSIVRILSAASVEFVLDNPSRPQYKTRSKPKSKVFT